MAEKYARVTELLRHFYGVLFRPRLLWKEIFPSAEGVAPYFYDKITKILQKLLLIEDMLKTKKASLLQQQVSGISLQPCFDCIQDVLLLIHRAKCVWEVMERHGRRMHQDATIIDVHLLLQELFEER